MKKKLFTSIILLFISSISSYSQSLGDMKEFIVEYIDANPAISSYDNYAMFKDDILKLHIKTFTGREVSQEEYENCFIYGIEAYTGENKSGNIWMEEAQVIDIRGIKKISTTKVADKNRNFYKIKLFINNGYLSTKYQKTTSTEPKISSTSELEIYISDNSSAALKIKKAFIKMGELIGITITDGDFF